jgi:trehalose 6-phosphate synthase
MENLREIGGDELELGTEAPGFWTRDTLRLVIGRVFADRQFLIVSNREPYVHRVEGERVVCERPVSGMVTALEPVARACGGRWVASASGNADRDVVDDRDLVALPPESPEFTLRRVWLGKKDEEDYYSGFANQALWPLCHIAYERPTFEAQDFAAYVRVNQQFAEAVLDQVTDERAIVLIQDYHFALLPRLLREAKPTLLLAHFWHIPWPNRETFRVSPWAPEILDGLLANDLLGFHIRYHCQNFLETVASTVEARVDHGDSSVTRAGHSTLVRPFPISLDFEAVSARASSREIAWRAERLRHELGLAGQTVLLGVDRIDYTKGIPERLRAVDRLLESHPEYLGKIRFVQIGAPSRTRIDRYRDLGREIEALVEEINWKHGQSRWTPILYRDVQHSPDEVLAFYRLADVCIASSLHDGMNLVAKEYAAARVDGCGVLVLSRFAGAAAELEHALQINPYAADEVATILHQAIEMDVAEQRARMSAMREVVARNNVYRWAGKMILELGRIASRRRLEAAA